MTITFFLKNHNKSVKFPNKEFNPNEVEDPIFNPREISEPIYPEINVSNVNARLILNFLEITEYEILKQDVNDFVLKINKKQLELSKCVNTDTNAYLSRILIKFDILGRYALALDDGIVWC